MDKTISFKSSAGLYNLTSKVQENTLLNRGILEIGGIAAPQVAMSNNKDEAIERAGLSGLFFGISFLTPFVLIPQFNKFFLRKSGIVNDFKGVEKKILEVSKKHLTKDADTMVKGIRQTAQELDNIDKTTKHKEAFEKILNRFPDKEVLRQKLLNTHKNIHSSDFLTTAWMLGAMPWGLMEFTERRTHKKGFSAAFEMKENTVDDKKYQSDKHKKMLANAIIATVPAILAPRLISKGIGQNHKALTESTNFIKKGYGNILELIKKKADCFDYTNSIFMSKTIFALMWLLSDYPNCLICSRDKHEVKDKAIRFGFMNLMFFGGDFLLNNVMGRLSDKFAGTKIMETEKLPKNSGFLKRFGLQMRSFKDLANVEGISAKELNRTKNMGAGIYWASLLINMGIIGLGLPAFLNRMLKNDIEKEKAMETAQFHPPLDKKIFKEFELS